MSSTDAKQLLSARDFMERIAIADVQLWTSTFTREADYLPGIHKGKMQPQSFREIALEEVVRRVDGDSVKCILRALTTFGIRSTYKDPAAVEDDEPVVLHTLVATFSIDFVVIDESLDPINDVPHEVIEGSLPVIAWPFWRAYVYDTFGRASLPKPTIPLLGAIVEEDDELEISILNQE